MKYKSKLTIMDSGTAKGTSLRGTVPESGIYRVLHTQHHLPEEVTLLANHEFPRCSRCAEAVFYELVRSAPLAGLLRPGTFVVSLYQLPEISDEPLEEPVDESLAG
jgi:hypothetical protein